MEMVGKAGLRPWLLVSSAAVVCMAQAGPAFAQARTFDVPAEAAAEAIPEFGQQAGIQILSSAKAVAGKQTNAVKGDFSVDEGLAILLKGTGLEVAPRDGSGIISIRASTSAPAAVSVLPSEAPTEVVVTGSHIRGANPTSPVKTVTRTDIEQSGYSQIGDLARSLPENFSGGQNPGVIAAASTNIGNQNISNASTINLRGLGTDATLVLLNGHRLSADAFYQGSDISMIPLAAVQRMEIVPDGASALYGSDAVAGVVNIITRRNFNGGEVSERLGAATQGGDGEQTTSLLVGSASSNKYGLISLEMSRTSGIIAGQRDFTQAAPAAETLLEPETKGSAFVSAGRDLSDVVSISFDGMVGDRDGHTTFQVTPTSAKSFRSFYTPSFMAAANVDVSLAANWKLHVTAVESGSLDTSISQSGTSVSRSVYKNGLQYIEATADGTLFQLPSGAVKSAFGLGYREEAFVSGFPSSITYVNASRDVAYAYGELSAPLVVPSPARTGLEQLDLDLSGRSERYSDFGTATTPKVGLLYVPFSDLTLRATWGQSFKAPSFNQMYQIGLVYLYKATTLGGTGAGTALETYGGNPDLKPERSTSWTVSGEYRPSVLPSLRLSATYFNIDFTDRVVQPVNPYTTGLSNPIFAPFVEATPTAARQAQLISDADLFVNATGSTYDPTSVVAVLHDEYTNATEQTVRGLDLSYRQNFNLPGSAINAFADGTWTRLLQQTIPTQPSVELSGTIFQVPKFKVRGGASWVVGSISATGIVNYVAGETDTGVTPHSQIGSWTTLDADVTYHLPASNGFANGLRVVLAASNLLDRAPPRATSPALSYPGLGFDSTNSSIIGRFVSLTVAKAW